MKREIPHSCEIERLRSWVLSPEKYVPEPLMVESNTAQQKHGLEEFRKIVWAKVNTWD